MRTTVCLLLGAVFALHLLASDSEAPGGLDLVSLVERTQRAADQGEASAQSALGFLYSTGILGVSPDYSEALKWYRKAAEQGFAGAQSNLGVMYYEGKGVAQDYAEALKWYRKAADQGYAEAQFNLGQMYYAGQGVPQDYVEAYMWLNLATAKRQHNADSVRRRVMKVMTPEQIAEGRRRAWAWVKAREKSVME